VVFCGFGLPATKIQNGPRSLLNSFVSFVSHKSSIRRVARKVYTEEVCVLSTNTTGFTGVCKTGNRFQAQITIGGKTQNIEVRLAQQQIGGCAIAWDLAAIPKSNLNFPKIKKKNYEI
jgi:hypothetical protein